MSTVYRGSICAEESDRETLERLGIQVGEHNGVDFINCTVPRAAMSGLAEYLFICHLCQVKVPEPKPELRGHKL